MLKTASSPQGVTGPKLLSRFLQERQISQRAAAAQIGVSRTALIFWLQGSQRPRERLRTAIERWTNGAVPAASWETKEERELIERVKPFSSEAA